MSYIKEWRQREVMAEVSGRVARGMENACVFAEGKAREYAPVYRGIMRDDITHEVTARANEVTGYVGVKWGRAFYALWVELGTRKMAARSFLRRAVFGHARQIVQLIAGR